MIGKRKAVPLLTRLLLATAAPVAAGGASWVNPSPAVPPSPMPREAAPSTAPGSEGAALIVSAWGFSRSPEGGVQQAGTLTGGPLYLWFDLRGNERATASLRAHGGLPIEVHWTPPAGPAPSAPPLTTELTIGRPGLAGALEGEVRRTGSFLWHGWAEKTTLSPGRWTVSLTYPDGRPLVCAPANRPCSFAIDIG